MNIRPTLIGSILAVIVMSSCKVSRLNTGQTTPDIPTEPEPPSYYITQKGDTLKSLGEEVDIAIHRLIKDTIRIIGVGDIMLGTNFPKPDYLPPDSGKFLLEAVRPVLQNADVTFGNLEGVILNDGGDQKKCKNPDLCYLFRSPEYLASELEKSGFDVMSTANNHAGDFGDTGRVNTMHVLENLGIAHAGQQTHPYTIFERQGMKFGFTAFAPNSGTMSILDHEGAAAIISKLDSICDVVIVSFHGGAEGKKHEHVTRETEEFYGENRGNVYQFSHDLIDAGADVIFGHGPHVVRAMEVYNDRFIIYSLGNFCTYARFNLTGPNALAPAIEVITNEYGEFLYGKIHGFIQSSPGGPQADTEGLCLEKFRQLTREDFPESNISFDDNGFIKRINQ